MRSSAPKSRTSRRRVPLGAKLDAELAAHVESHRLRDDPRAALFPARWANREWVHDHARQDPFNWDKPIDPGAFRERVFDPACKEAGVGKVRLHDLRHTCGSLLLAAGESVWVVSQILGHASLEITAKVYGHTYSASLDAAASRLDAFVSSADAKVIPLRRQG